ncbi:MAG: 4Fe-4S binding protein [Deltaproteobacteria bacterium]|nr:4Fe-4S binding protein [Deltaproteobacteria bacterium]
MTPSRDVKRTARRISQAAFLLLFFVLLVKTDYDGRNELAYPVKVFLDGDLLVFVTSLLSAHALPAALFLALLFVPVTLLFGRAFCGWVCPFGTLHHAASYAGRGPVPERGVKTAGVRWKFAALVFLLGAALSGIELAGLLDPISFLIRSLSLSVMPAVDAALRAVLDWGYRLPWRPVSDAFDAAYTFLRTHFLSFFPARYGQALLFFALFVLLLALNRKRTRFFCRFVCPLGGLLGLLSRASLLRLSMNGKCNRCMKCRDVCAGGANPHLGGEWSPSECVTCFNCTAACPEGALEWTFAAARGTKDRVDLRRRAALASVALGASTAWVFRSTPAAARPAPGLVRPPGSRPEGEFLARCVRCGECMKVCITGGLQPTLLEAGLEGIWTPVLASKIGYCEFNCTLCGQVCPTSAIRRLSIPEKQKTVIGLAFVDPSRCIPFAQGTPCIVCEEHCPTPRKAIGFRERPGKGGRPVKAPVVITDLCIGCGICEFKCPVADLAGIRVTSVGETRNPDNRLDLPPPPFPP